MLFMNDRCPSCVQSAKYVGFCPTERDELTTALAQSWQFMVMRLVGMPLFRARRTGNWLKMDDDGELEAWKIRSRNLVDQVEKL